MKITFLAASVPLTKTFTKTKTEITKTPYPMTWEFTSHEENIGSLRDLEAQLTKHAALGHCAIKGTIKRPLVSESRAGATTTSDATEWLVLDLDGIPDTHNKQTMTIDLFLEAMGLKDISYIVQWSASQGIFDSRMRAHIFMLLDKPMAAPLIKQWLIQKNHEVAFLNESMELTKSNNAIRWPLDISACQNDKLIYIAPPDLKGVKDPFVKKRRIELIKKKHEKVSISSTINSTEKNRALTHARMDKLREDQGLPKRKYTYKAAAGAEVMLKPDSCVITEMKVDRGFVYFNLNGGDSWAYYHPEDKPDYIYNFKGEPAYPTKELLPDYWHEITSSGVTRTSSSGLVYLAFLDRKTSTYWRGHYNTSTDELSINQAKNETQVRHFCAQYGIPIGDYIPEWDLTFDPHSQLRVDFVNKQVNRFSASPYMLATPKKVRQCPPTIFKVMHHALGGDLEVTEHFVNWCAYILQKRDRTKTAWVLHGTQGTGKGVLTNNILRPIFAPHCASRRMEELNEKYNHFMADALFVFVDETQIKALGNEKGVMAKLKNFITEELVPLRTMHAVAIEVRNYSNWIFMSNMPDPVMIDKGDRRFNVGRYQTERLHLTDADFAQIESELQAFHDYLMGYVMDPNKAREITTNADREHMISLTETSVDTVVTALVNGSFEFFIDQLPTDDSHKRNAAALTKVNDYKDTLSALMLRTQAKGSCAISREELRAIMNYVVGNIPESPNKFTSLMKHHRVHMQAVWNGEKTVRGVPVTWVDYAQFPAWSKAHFPVVGKPTASTAKKGKP